MYFFIKLPLHYKSGLAPKAISIDIAEVFKSPYTKNNLTFFPPSYSLYTISKKNLDL